MNLADLSEVDLASLPTDCVVRALVFLDNVADIKNFGATCQRFRVLVQSPEIWRMRLKKDFDLSVKVGQ